MDDDEKKMMRWPSWRNYARQDLTDPQGVRRRTMLISTILMLITTALSIYLGILLGYKVGLRHGSADAIAKMTGADHE